MKTFLFAGKDESSKQMTELIENEAITHKLESDAFVSVKVESDKEEYMQFAKICKSRETSSAQRHVTSNCTLFSRSTRSCPFNIFH
jgi:hypothetical protein